MSALGEPLSLTAGVRLRNRFVATAHASGAVVDGIPLPADADYWRRLAAGGVAMCIVGGTVVADNSTQRRGNVTNAGRPEAAPGLRRRAEAIRSEGATAIMQLLHLGRETLGAETYYAPVAPSAVRSPREPTAPRALGDHEIDALVEDFARAAAHALEAGFHGFELHAAHGYLFGQFLSPVANRRPGAETVAGRAEPVWRVVDAVRELSPDCPIGIRLSVGGEADAGTSLEQLEEMLAQLHPEIAYVNLTVGMRSQYVRDMATEQPPLLADVGRIRAMTDRPLLISQAFRDQRTMEAALQAGADLVGMARALIADPQLPRKVLGGRAGEVRPCVACNEDCRSFEPALLCTVNPSLAPPGEPVRPGDPLVLDGGGDAPARRVAVVGAGPAGLECALSLASAGPAAPEVVVFERADAVGGALAVAGSAPHRHGWLPLLDFYRRRLDDLEVQLRLGAAATRDDLEDFDAVVVATGAEEVLAVDDPAGFLRPSGAAIAAGPTAVGGAAHVAVVDDGFAWWPSVSAVELALAAGAKRVTLVTPGAAFATGIPHESRAQLMPRLRGLALAMRPLTMLQAAGDGWLDLRATTSATVERLEVDAAIVVGERRPRDRSAFVPDGVRTIVVGDAIVPRRASHAIAEGRAAARVLAGTRTDAVVA